MKKHPQLLQLDISFSTGSEKWLNPYDEDLFRLLTAGEIIAKHGLPQLLDCRYLRRLCLFSWYEAYDDEVEDVMFDVER